MDARRWENSQSCRPSIKRPWDEETSIPESSNAWRGSILPPIGNAPYRRLSVQHTAEHGGGSNSQFHPEARESVAKKARFKEDYSFLPREDKSLDGDTPKSRLSHYTYTSHRGSLDSSSFQKTQHGAGWDRQGRDSEGPAGSQDASPLCSRCKRLTIQPQDLENLESCENCKNNPELSKVTQSAATGLSQLAETLISNMSFGRRGIIRESESRDPEAGASANCPSIAQFGLKHTLEWIVGQIHFVNELAERLVQHDPQGNLHQLDQNSLGNGTNNQNGLHHIIQRRIDADPDDASRLRDDGIDLASDIKLHTRRRSVTMVIPTTEELPSIRSPHNYHLHSSTDGPGQRASVMNPPPAPNRQLLSPPGRLLLEPTSLNLPSQSAASYGSTPLSINLPPPSNLNASSSSKYLPPIGSGHSSDIALQAHSAALQHEVSIQKIALSSLQGEHNKLLAAFSRSQARAIGLEKKHAVSDGEIISLTEEKFRLQAQVTELDRDVEELSRSRDDFRQAAVQEGAQYVEIVKKASRLEEITGEERKNWNKLKSEMEQRIDSLGNKVSRNDEMTSTKDTTPMTRRIDGMDTPVSSFEVPADMKVEPTGYSRSVGPTLNVSNIQQDATKELEGEIRRLRNRCVDMENALRAVRDDSRSVEGIVQALGMAGRSIMERADRALGNIPEEG